MPAIEDYIDKKYYFNQLFEKLTIAIETTDYYDYPNKKYETLYIDVFSKLKEKKGEVEVIATNLYIELHSRIHRGMFSSDLVPQVIDYELNDTILVYPGEELFGEEWDRAFEEHVLEAVKQNITSYTGHNSSGDEKSYSFKVQDVWVVE